MWFFTLPFFYWLDLTNLNHWYSLRFEKDSRYYVLRLQQDLLEDWTIIAINGRIKSKLGQSRILAYSSYDETYQALIEHVHIRQQRGYRLTTWSTDNPFFDNPVWIVLIASVSQNTPHRKVRKNAIAKIKSTTCLIKDDKPNSLQLGFQF